MAFDLMAANNDVLESGMLNLVLRQTITVSPYYYDIFKASVYKHAVVHNFLVICMT